MYAKNFNENKIKARICNANRHKKFIFKIFQFIKIFLFQNYDKIIKKDFQD